MIGYSENDILLKVLYLLLDTRVSYTLDNILPQGSYFFFILVRHPEKIQRNGKNNEVDLT